MNPIAKLVVLLSVLSAVVPSAVAAETTALPIKISENKRYFTDQQDRPVFWLGTTQWQLFRGYTLAEAKTILKKSRSHGFTFVQVMLLGVGDGTAPNVYGEKPWLDNNPLTPNDAYFKHVDSVLRPPPTAT